MESAEKRTLRLFVYVTTNEFQYITIGRLVSSEKLDLIGWLVSCEK